MIFADLTFLYLFLPLNLLLYFAVPRNGWRNTVLTAFSLVFYAWGEPIWIILLIFSATIDYFHGLGIAKYPGTKIPKLMVISSLVLNLGLLGVFKYADFFIGTFNSLTGLSLPMMGVTLPIGISFYTFQTISYTIDVYRGKIPAQRSYSKFLMYVSMYPQLVAGPIVRYQSVMPEIENRKTNFEHFSAGVTRFCMGLLKKVYIANHAGKLASVYLDRDLSKLSTPAAWFGLLMYTIQIYYDFSGYSDMAIGLGRIFGFNFPENFNYPYTSRSISEFWRRWHISLGSFFRDYVYIPLGGNRHHLIRNLMITWFLTGMWHGASWNFILWGLFYGVLILFERLFLGKTLCRIPVLNRIYTLFCVVLGWALFYFTDMSRLGSFVKVLFGGGAAIDPMLTVTLSNNLFWLIAAVLFCAPLAPAFWSWLLGVTHSDRGIEAVGWAQTLINVFILLVCTALLVGQSYNPFLYFRF
ncbi:MAG: MBOAT family protein [Oscillospiraceae bacterium]|nr:MBOAT family protein [Oscillospiraceae bacterium]